MQSSLQACVLFVALQSIGAQTKNAISSPVVYNVKDFGVVGDGRTVNTEAIKDVFTECRNNKGEWMGPIVCQPASGDLQAAPRGVPNVC